LHTRVEKLFHLAFEIGRKCCIGLMIVSSRLIFLLPLAELRVEIVEVYHTTLTSGF
jgi:hypothetical protein